MCHRLQKEFQLIQKAFNNHVVRVFGWVKWPEAIGLAMEYMPGGNLAQFLDDDVVGPSMLVFLRIFRELASALAFIHHLPGIKRIVHSDLKPENVLLTSQLHCKVSDFGSGHLVGITGFTTSQSDSPKKMDMTLAYAAPEKLKSLNIKPKKEQDTYSFGMMLYAVLSGSPPYQHTSHETAFRESIIKGERPDETSIDDMKATLCASKQHILDVLRSIMKMCWVQDPSDRPNMIKVQDDLQSLLDLQSEEQIANEVKVLLKSVRIYFPKKEESQLLPLHKFSPKQGRFVEGKF